VNTNHVTKVTFEVIEYCQFSVYLNIVSLVFT